MNIIIQTPRLVIREFSPREEYLLIDLYKDDRVTRFTNRRTEEQTLTHFFKTLREYENNPGFGRWAVFNLPDKDFIGYCALKPVAPAPSHIELGFMLARKYWGQGIATEIAKTLISYGFERQGLTEICATTHPENSASQNVLLKAGLIREGNVRWHGKEEYFFRVSRTGVPNLK